MRRGVESCRSQLYNAWGDTMGEDKIAAAILTVVVVMKTHKTEYGGNDAEKNILALYERMLQAVSPSGGRSGKRR